MIEKNWQDIAAEIYSENLDLNSGQIHRELIARIGSVSRAPSLSAVQKWRQKNKPKAPELRELDSPWHLGLLENETLPVDMKRWFTAEAINVIEDVCKHIDTLNKAFNKASESCGMLRDEIYLTVGEAKWLSRIYKTAIENMPKKMKKGLNPVQTYLIRWSAAYVVHEKLCILSGTAPDTRDLDRALRKGANPVVSGDRYAILDYKNNTFLTDPQTHLKMIEQKEDGEKRTFTIPEILSHSVLKKDGEQ